MAVHRTLDQCRDDFCAGGLPKRGVSESSRPASPGDCIPLYIVMACDGILNHRTVLNECGIASHMSRSRRIFLVELRQRVRVCSVAAFAFTVVPSKK
jgi:hypothetical protein